MLVGGLVARELEEDLLERSGARCQLVERQAGGERQVADLRGAETGDEQHAVLGAADLGSGSLDNRGEVREARRAHAHLPRAHQAVDRALVDEPAVVDHDHVVDGLRDLAEHVARDQHGPALGGKRAQEVAQPANSLRVEAVGGLVEHEQLRVAEQRRGEREPLAHARRVLARATVGGSRQFDELQHGFDARGGQPGQHGQRTQMVTPRPPGVKARNLERRADRSDRVGERRERPAEDRRLARGRPRQAEQDTQRRRLAGAVRAQEPGHGASPHLEREAVYGSDIAVALAESGDADRAAASVIWHELQPIARVGGERRTGACRCTADIAENRLLRGATELLLRFPRVPELARKRLLRIRATLEDVAPATPRQAIKAPPITRLNARYRAALALSELILQQFSITTSAGRVRTVSFVFDMNTVFEDFLSTALRASLERIGGQVRLQYRHERLDHQRRIRLTPDITWWQGNKCRAVIDAKHKPLKDARFPNADAYQMLAYCTAFGLKRGYLVYAKDAGEATRRHKMRNADVVIDVKAIDVQLEPDYLCSRTSPSSHVSSPRAPVRARPGMGPPGRLHGAPAAGRRRHRALSRSRGDRPFAGPSEPGRRPTLDRVRRTLPGRFPGGTRDDADRVSPDRRTAGAAAPRRSEAIRGLRAAAERLFKGDGSRAWLYGAA